MKSVLVATAVFVLAAAPAFAQATPKPVSSTDQEFMINTAKAGMAEVELGKMAAEKGSSDAVKQFGKRMADDHAKASDELKQFAQQKGLTLPTDLDAKHKQLRDRLAKLNGVDFDKAYANEMVKDHKKDVADFKRQAKSAKDPDLKSWAGKTLPTLEDHLKQAQDMQAQVKSAPRAAR